MKKIIIVMVVLLMALTGCSTKGYPIWTNQSTTETSEMASLRKTYESIVNADNVKTVSITTVGPNSSYREENNADNISKWQQLIGSIRLSRGEEVYVKAYEIGEYIGGFCREVVFHLENGNKLRVNIFCDMMIMMDEYFYVIDNIEEIKDDFDELLQCAIKI